MDYLRDKQNTTGKLGAVGFSFGGHLAYLAATELDVAAAAVFYGGWLTSTDIALGQPVSTLDRTADITDRVLFLVGDNDHAVPMDQVRHIEAELAKARVRHEVVVYPDTRTASSPTNATPTGRSQPRTPGAASPTCWPRNCANAAAGARSRAAAHA